MNSAMRISDLHLPSILSPGKRDLNGTYPHRIKDMSIGNYHSSFPSEGELARAFGEAFVINQPVDSVGGDGYWVFDSGDYSVLAVFDCMGHGRVASMMTRYYLRVIYDEVHHKGLRNPGAILAGIHYQVESEFGNKAELRQSSADVGILVHEKSSGAIWFAGASMDLIMAQNGEATRIKGGKYGVGEYFEIERRYEPVLLRRQPQDVRYYLFSDGATDLMGGPKNKRMGFARLAGLLASYTQVGLAEEKNMLTREFNRWLGANDPLDDLLLIGLKM